MSCPIFEEGVEERPKPANNRKQLLPNIVDGMARARPEAVYAEYPTNPESYADGFSRLTYERFANVVSALAWWLEENLGPGDGQFKTLVYFGPNDFRQNALVLAGCKVGYKLLLCSPRNTLAGYQALLGALEVQTVLVAGPPYALPILDTIMGSCRMRQLLIAPPDQLLAIKSHHYPFNKRFMDAANEPLLVLHTSGTTALPKPIIITHNWVSSWVQSLHEDPPHGTESLDRLHQGNRVLVMMPPFHGGNMMPTLFDAVHNQSIIIFPLPGAILSPDHFHEHFVACVHGGRPDIAVLPAGFIHEIAKVPALLDLAAKFLSYILYTGGDVADVYGNALSARVKLFNINGSTELGSYPILRHAGDWDRTSWKCIMPHPIAGIDFRYHSGSSSGDGDAQYEAVIVRSPDPDKIQPVFTVFPNRQEYRTGDLFSAHASIPDSWVYRGRADDCFVLVTGSNINPLGMERHVEAHAAVKAALMIGQRRLWPGLLVELEDVEQAKMDGNEEERRMIIDRIWPAVERGNQEYYDLARVSKDRIIFTTPSRPMQRTPKGTVQRRLTCELYQEEIAKMYGSV
ncbi:hypothetical protein BDV12DRAFT_200434 [Aspergillus spectabilis]